VRASWAAYQVRGRRPTKQQAGADPLTPLFSESFWNGARSKQGAPVQILAEICANCATAPSTAERRYAPRAELPVG